ncbi:MAG: exonuclease sbcCD subunit [Chlamydiales bacterium]|jgi:exonuclease SbcD|nr:exonuclease sbcCD subunit [Chlamydiales bacterium]
MSLRILHTSDWHLGATLEGESREKEHRVFLDWLLVTLEEKKVDLLIVAGDIFQYTQPSSEAQKIYYRFLAEVGVKTQVGQVIVVGGNHDSASRLDAPAEILDALKVHVVGGYHLSQPLENYLCPIKNKEGFLQAVVVTLPFIHEFRLGVRTTERQKEEIAAEFRQLFTNLYSRLADLANKIYPQVPLIATGHLTCMGVAKEEVGTEIHHAGTIGGLPCEIFDNRYHYIALGHIHRTRQIGSRNIWYSGSPIALNIGEATYAKNVILIDIEGDQVKTSILPIPCWRQLLLIKGEIEEICKQLKSLSWSEPFPPYLYIEIMVEHYDSHLYADLQKCLEQFSTEQRPLIVNVKQSYSCTANDREGASSELTDKSLLDLTPQQVFLRLYETKYQKSPSEDLLIAFNTVLGSLDKDQL